MPRTRPSRTIPGELALIRAIRHQAASTRSRFLTAGIGDDCAVLRPKRGCEICVTTDFSLEGRHFHRDWHPPQSAGHRCLARGLSDLAAMGAEPVAVFLSLALPAKLPASWFEGFMDGFLALARQHNVPLAGGDTAQSPVSSNRSDGQGSILADIVAIGQLPRGRALLRSGARPGDILYVTGVLGGAAAELLALSRHSARYRSLKRQGKDHPHLYPQPRLAAGRRLRTLATACIDISDGLSTDLTHLCRASRVAAVLQESALPIHPLAHATADPLSLALHGGEDYELLFTARPDTRIPQSLAGIPIHSIGILEKQARNRPLISLEAASGSHSPLEPRGWEHFRRQLAPKDV